MFVWIARKNHYISSRYNTFNSKYESTISLSVDKDKLKALIYAIMIYEDYNRPKLIRFVEYIWFYLTRKPLIMGVMQVRSKVYIDDFASVQSGVALILGYYQESIKEFQKDDSSYERYHFLPLLIGKYNGGTKYQNDILELYDELLHKYYPKTQDQLIKKTQ